ncbi:MAG: PAS domain S-box protein [Deltaproteobacteria bacterium]|nr:PAS domain S-box protein [Deltaproteobacteria bacterium]
MIFIVCDGQIVYMNDTGLKLLGASYAAELIGKPIMAFIHPDSRDLIRKRIPQVLEERKRTALIEQKYLKLDGDILEVEAMGLPVLYRNLPAAQVYARDVTKRKEMEEALFRSQEQLRQAQKMEAVGRLAGGVAHDFNNFLTAINGYAELLMARVQDGDPVPREIAEIRRVGERAAALTRQLLAFSRKQVLMPKVFELNGAVTGVSEMLRGFLGANIEFRTSFGENLWPVRADPGQIEQVIMNLAINARDAMAEGGVLSIETQNVVVSEPIPVGTGQVPPGSYVVLTIADTGCGMDQATMSHLFEPFFTTKEKGKGTGLGLATVYGIVKQSGGFLLVESEKGKGTTFRIYLYRTDAEVTEEAPAKGRETLSRGKGIVMVVEDQEEIRNLIVEVLAMQGYTVLGAANGDEALRLSGAAKKNIQLLLTDLVMPCPDMSREMRPRIPS